LLPPGADALAMTFPTSSRFSAAPLSRRFGRLRTLCTETSGGRAGGIPVARHICVGRGVSCAHGAGEPQLPSWGPPRPVVGETQEERSLVDNEALKKLSPGAQALVRRAVQLATAGGADVPGGNHWLAALLERPGPMAQRLAGVDPTAERRRSMTCCRRAADRAAGRGAPHGTETDVAATILVAAGLNVEPTPGGSPGAGSPCAEPGTGVAPATPTIDKFGRDLTREAAEAKLLPVMATSSSSTRSWAPPATARSSRLWSWPSPPPPTGWMMRSLPSGAARGQWTSWESSGPARGSGAPFDGCPHPLSCRDQGSGVRLGLSAARRRLRAPV